MTRITPLLKDIPFFRERGLKEHALADLLSLFTLQTVPKHQIVFEYGSAGSDFYFILDGTVEILIPGKSGLDDYKSAAFEVGALAEGLRKARADAIGLVTYRARLER